MRMIRGALAAASALTLLAVAAPAQAVPTAVAAPAAPYTALVLDGHQGSYLLSGTLSFDSSNATVAGTPFSGSQLTVSASSGAEAWSVSLAPPTGAAWTVGTTYPTSRTASATTARVDLAGDNRGCNQEPGSMTVEQATAGSDTLLTAFAATFTIGCEGSAPAVTGEIRWNSSVGYTGVTTNAASQAWGRQPAGVTAASKTVTFTSTGSDPVTFGAASITGGNPASFLVTANTCTSKTLSYRQTCTVSVATRPTAAGALTAYLALADSTASGQKYVALSVNSYIGAVGTYYPVSPNRILDTRTGLGAPKAPLGPGGVLHLQVAGQGGIPSTGAGAVVLNVTVTGATISSYLAVYPDGGTLPNTSSLNFAAGWTGANNVTSALGANGKVSIYNSRGNVQVIADVLGYYGGSDVLIDNGTGPGGQFQPVVPQRLLDTRTEGGKLPAGYYIDLPVDFGATINPHIKALVVNVTAVWPDTGGYLATWNGLPDQLPSTSTLDYTNGSVVPNLAVVPTAPCQDCGTATGLPAIGVYTNANTHVLVDLMGVYDDGTLSNGLRFSPQTPSRIVDSRIGLGIGGAIGGGSAAAVTTPSSVLVPDTWALALNVTAVTPTARTFLTVWPDGVARPGTSNLNPAQGQTVPNAVDTLISPANLFDVYNSVGTVNVLVDAVGAFYLYGPTASSGTPARGGGTAGHVRVPQAALPGSLRHQTS